MKKHSRNLRILIPGGIILVFLFYLLLPVPKFEKDYSVLILDNKNRILRAYPNQDEQWIFPASYCETIPYKLKQAVVVSEDYYFYKHPGVNPISLYKAYKENKAAGRIVRGGSTITMQVCRILTNKPRTYLNKFIEILQAVKLETLYTKEEILQFYLYHAPYGGNIIGFPAASNFYFQKQPSNLTWSEAAAFAILPNAPATITPFKNKETFIKRRNLLLKKLLSLDIIDAETYKLALKEKLPKKINNIHFHAPHFADWIKQKNKTTTQTTIDLDIQQKIEQLIKIKTKSLTALGIKNVACLIVHTQTGEIKSWIGSQNYFDTENQGMVNGVIAPRSSASTLKPFLYGLAYHNRYLLPDSIMFDVPTSFEGFMPINADQKYRGIVRSEQALIQSLNVPAVRLLNLYGLYEFYDFLRLSDVSTLYRSAHDYGLTLIIGGAEVTLYDLVKLYRGLGRFGTFEPIYHQKPINPIGLSTKLISPGASYLTLEVLKQLKRPGSEYYWEQYANQWPIAWKTGTSYGQRDGWAIGVSPEWTIGVWVGNFTGECNANLSGAGSAGPILFNIYNLLSKNPTTYWFKKPNSNLTEIKICKETGFKANEYCPNKSKVLAPISQKIYPTCRYHRNAFIDQKTGYEVCSQCWTQGRFKEKVMLSYPPLVMNTLRKRGNLIQVIPIHNPECRDRKANSLLSIDYPKENNVILLPRDLDGELQKITLKASHQQSSQILYWYIDNHYLGSTYNLHQQSIRLTQGKHVLVVIDTNGTTVKRTFKLFCSIQN